MSDDNTAIDALVALFENQQLPSYRGPGQHSLSCDYCSGTIHANNRISFYASTAELNPNSEGRPGNLNVQRYYCVSCDRSRIRHPCGQYFEVLMSTRLEDRRVFRDCGLLDASPSGDGPPFDPDELARHHLGSEMWNMMKNSKMDEYDPAPPTLGPEDVIDQLVMYGRDPREIIGDDGAIDTSSKAIGDTRRGIEEIREEFDSRSPDSKEYTKFVREKR